MRDEHDVYHVADLARVVLIVRRLSYPGGGSAKLSEIGVDGEIRQTQSVVARAECNFVRFYEECSLKKPYGCARLKKAIWVRTVEGHMMCIM